MTQHGFSEDLEKWLNGKQKKTLHSLGEVFAEKSFAVLFLVLMFFPSLPIPTGGVTHFVMLPIAMLLSLELIIGRDHIWLPAKAKQRRLGGLTEKRVLPFMMRRIRWFEKFARPRFTGIMTNHRFGQAYGLTVLIYALAAFFAPPFSGLDTLPAFGVVVMSLGIILEDGLIYVIGFISGVIGITLSVLFGAAIAKVVAGIFA